jgi:hypothetical protein
MQSGAQEPIHNTFFVTYEWANQARVAFPGKLFKPNVMQHSSLLSLFSSHKENEVVVNNASTGRYTQVGSSLAHT